MPPAPGIELFPFPLWIAPEEHIWEVTLEAESQMSANSWRIESPNAAVFGLLCTVLAGCNSIYDKIHGAAYGFYREIPECDMVPIGRAYDLPRDLDVRHLKCMAELFRRHLAKEFPRDTTPARLEAWLKHDGFQCAPAESDTDPIRVCASQRISEYRRVLSTTGPVEHVWRVYLRELTPVLGTVRIEISHPVRGD